MFILFAIISIIVYGALIWYIGWSGYRGFALNRLKWLKWLYIFILVFVSVSFIFGRFGQGSTFLTLIGSYWIAIFCLLLLLIPLAQIMLIVFKLFKRHTSKVTRIVSIVTLGAMISVMLYGSYLAYTPVVREYDVNIEKSSSQSLKVVMFSDTHFGYLTSEKHTIELVEKVNALEPDIVLIPGDIIDDQLQIFIDKGIAAVLSGINSKYGVYGTLGNHDKDEVGMMKLIEVLETANIQILYDEVELVDDQFYLVGRKDKTEERLPTMELVADLDRSKPIILLDHQPYEYELALEAGVDLVLSGHTHYGQIFPGNLITGALYENDWGHYMKGEMDTIVSSGYGFWGPPVRIGSQSEIVLINVSFE